ncbi:MAG: D-aminoacyl-tRNA deacylase [Sphaerochaetaceae bacterium]|nr:D-aminoacyl-tRNA deacylase [Sphaerochaetaceae bacterium]
MKAVIQRVQEAEVRVDEILIGSIDKGILIYLGIEENDSEMQLNKLADKIVKFRMFSDQEGKMNLNVKEVEGKILVVSQFTLCASLKKGNRPSFDPAASPEKALNFYNQFVNLLKLKNIEVQTGKFGADMKVKYQNNGPVTFIFEL